MALSVMGWNSGTQANGLSCGTLLPPGLVAGDLMVAFVCAKETAQPPGLTYSVLDELGWTGLPEYAGTNPPYMRVRPFCKIAAAGEVGPTFDISAFSTNFLGIPIVGVRGGAQVFRGSNGGNSDGAAPFTMNGFTMPVAGPVMLLGCIAFSRDGTTFTFPAGYGTSVDTGLGGVGGMRFGVAYLNYTGATPPAADWGVANGGIAQMYHVAVGAAPVKGFAGEPGGGLW